MLGLWKTRFLNYRAILTSQTGFCFSTFLPKTRMSRPRVLVEIKLEPMNEMPKRKKEEPKSMNERLAAIRNQGIENVTPNVPQTKVTLSKNNNHSDPWKLVMSFFDKLSEQKKIKYTLSPNYQRLGDFIQCTIQLKYPFYVRIHSVGESKRVALQSCSLEILELLKEHNCLETNELLTYYDFVKRTKEYDDQRKLNPGLGILFKKALLDVNRNITPQPLCTTKRDFSTSKTLNLRNKLSQKPKTIQREIQSKIFQSQPPKSIINNYYAMVSNYLNQPFILTPSYTLTKSKISQWVCNYHIKWPEDKIFTNSGVTKKEAATKVCLEILNYLKDLNLINEKGGPILKEGKVNPKPQTKIISLKDDIIRRLEKIEEIYKEKLLKALPECAINVDDDDNDEGLFSKQRRLQKKSLGFYLVEEKTLLPISKFKNDIIEAVDKNQVIIIKGEPGCGKSTRVPQYILEGWAKNDESDAHCRIVVTQPRRIAAISLAERVSYERGERVGQSVGYQVRLQNAFCPRTGRILYCTTGILLRKMQADPSLDDCSHVILDEAHERDVNTDLLMNLLRGALEKNKNLKVIVMSATIDTGIFQEYFKSSPVFNVPGFTYPVKQNFISYTNPIDFSKTLQMCESKNPKVVCEDVAKMIEYIHNTKEDGAVLCFLPGWEDIKTVAELLETHPNLQVLCLHSRLSMRDQKLIFSKPPIGFRKVILSTNIAETSVTINDVVYVVDTGIQKETKFDITKGVTCLDNSWISQANIQQRKGRAGRCQPGESFHLYPKEKRDEFDEFPIPEILRTSLTKIVLDSKVYSNNMNAIEFMSQLISPPSDEAVKLAVNELIDLELLDIDENLTSLGRALANFQLEPKLAKTLVNAMIFKCVTPIIDIVTLFSEEKELFTGGLYSKEKVKELKRQFCKNSDHLALMKMFEQWLEYVETDRKISGEKFCAQYNLVESKLLTLQQLRDIHFEYLEKYLKNVLPISDDLSDNDELVKGVLLSGVGTLMEHFEYLKGKKKKHVLLTRNGHNAVITTESVNSKRSSYTSDYLIYINEVVSNVRKTSVIRETSVVSLLTVLLFKNNSILIEDLPQKEHSQDINSSDQVLLKLENTKYKYICDRRQAEAIKSCKEVLRSILQYYIFQLTSSGVHNKGVNASWDEMLKELNSILEDVQI